MNTKIDKDFLTEQDLSNHDLKPSTQLRNIKDEMDSYDFDAPYQRDYVWTKEKKCNLILSVLYGIPIGTIHLIKRSEDKKVKLWFILDAKQRLKTFKEWFNNELSIQYLKQNLTWKNLQQDHPDVADKFIKYEVQVCYWEHMNLVKQAKLFDRINACEQLTNNEKIYCSNFLCKMLLEEIFATYKQGWLNCLRKEYVKGKRMTGLRWLHSTMTKCFGKNLKDSCSYSRKTNSKDIKDSAQEINKIMLEYIGDNLDKFNETLLTKELLNEAFDGLEKKIKIFNNILKFINNGGRRHGVDVTDLCVFFYYKISNNQYSFSSLEENLDKIKIVFEKFSAWKNEKNYKRHQNNQSVIEDVWKWLEVNFEFIPKINNQQLSQEEKEQILNTYNKCGICGSTENLQIDHVNPKSTNEETKFGVLCKFCNGKKSNTPIQWNKNLINYVELNS